MDYSLHILIGFDCIPTYISKRELKGYRLVSPLVFTIYWLMLYLPIFQIIKPYHAVWRCRSKDVRAIYRWHMELLMNYSLLSSSLSWPLQNWKPSALIRLLQPMEAVSLQWRKASIAIELGDLTKCNNIMIIWWQLAWVFLMLQIRIIWLFLSLEILRQFLAHRRTGLLTVS